MPSRHRLLSVFTTTLLFSLVVHLPIATPSGMNTAMAQPTNSEDQKAEADRLLEQGIQQAETGQFQEATELWEAALQIYQRIGDREGEAASFDNLGIAYRSIGQYQQAIEFHEQSLAFYQNIGDQEGEAISLNNLGNAYQALAQYQQAVEFFQQSLFRFQSIDEQGGEANVLMNLGNTYNSLGQYQQAIEFFQQSRALFQDIDDKKGENALLNNIGNAYISLGQYQQALEFFQQSLNFLEDVGDRGAEAILLDSLGNTYSLLGQYQQAIEFYQQSLIITQDIGDQSGQANSLSNLGNAYLWAGQYQRAIDLLQQSLAISQNIGDRSSEASAQNVLGAVYGSLEQYQQAIGFFQQSLAISQDIGDPSSEASSLANLGYVYYFLEQYQQAAELYQQSLAISQSIGALRTEAGVLSNIGELLVAQNQPELAIVFYKQSVNRYETIREDNHALSQELQDSYTGTIEDTYRSLADLLLQQDRVLEAQRVLDLLKVQELDDYLRGVQRNAETEAGVVIRPTEAEIFQLYEAHQHELIALGQELTQLSDISLPDRTAAQADRITELRQLQQVALQVFRDFFQSQEITAIVAQLRQTTAATNLELPELNALRDNLQNLQQKAVVLYPLVLDDRLELVLVTADTPPVRRTTAVRREDLNRVIAEFRSALQSPDRDALTPAQQLYDWLIRPLENDLAQAGADTIIYAPDAQLRYIPLAALHDGSQWLVEQYAVNNITAASLQDLDNQPTTELSVLAAAFTEGEYNVQVGDRTLSFSGLQFAGQEVDNLTTQIPQTVTRLNGEFNRDLVLEMDDYRIVHLATHATFNPGPPENSFILFGDGDRATLTDIGSWSFPAVDLMVLSACETAVGDVPLGNGAEILGFGYLMQLAGSDAALASLWQVSDGGTQALMDAFYAALGQGMTKAEALRHAQIALATDDFAGLEDESRGIVGIRQRIHDSVSANVADHLTHPYYWAPFILIGNGL